MNEARFMELLSGYGAELSRWPEDDRGDAEAFLDGAPHRIKDIWKANGRSITSWRWKRTVPRRSRWRRACWRFRQTDAACTVPRACLPGGVRRNGWLEAR